MAKKKKSTAKTTKKNKPKLKATPTTKPWWKKQQLLLVGILLTMLNLLVYAPAANSDFVNWDDEDYVTENSYIRNLDKEAVKTFFTEPIAANYHPLTMLSLAINYKFSGLYAPAYHKTNIIFHILNTLLVLWFAFLFFQRKLAGAVVVALLFAIHPMHVESVAWIAERKDVLYTFFYLLGLISYLKYLGDAKNKWLVFTLLLFVLSLLSKPAAVTFPLVLLLLDWYHKRNWNMRMGIEKIPFFLLALWFGYQTIAIQSDAAIGDWTDYGIFERISFASYGLFHYLKSFILPFNMSAFHPYPGSPLPLIYKIAPVLIIGLSVLIFLWSKRNKIVAFGFLFFLLHLLLTLQFVQVGDAIVADRYTYVAYLGLMLIIGCEINYFLASTEPKIANNRWIPMAMLALFSLMFSALTYRQASTWNNSATLWTHAIKQYPNSSEIHQFRGNFYADQNLNDRALTDLNQSLKLDPENYKALISKGRILTNQQKHQEALALYNKAIEIDASLPSAYSNRGFLFAAMNKFPEAEADFKMLLEKNPDDPRAYANLGSVYYQYQDFDQALLYFNNAILKDPDFPDPYRNRGIIASEQSRSTEALSDFTKLIQLNPDGDGYFLRGREHQRKGNLRQALKDYDRAAKLEPTNSQIFKNRGAIHQNLGNTEAAGQDFSTARELQLNDKIIK